jgi:putative endonuclease
VTAPHLRLGEIGEQLVADRLSARGHQILERNWRGRGGELDLITIRNDILHFVEVKTRTGSQTVGGVWDTISASKRRKLARTAEAYLLDPPPHDGCVFTVALVHAVEDELKVEIIEDAFDSPR